MNIQDIRPNCQAECCPDASGYAALCRDTLTPALAESVLPDRAMLATVWRYLASVPGGQLKETPTCLCRKIVRRSGMPLSLGQMLTCLDIFRDVELITLEHKHKYLSLCLVPQQEKADLMQSRTMQRLKAAKES